MPGILFTTNHVCYTSFYVKSLLYKETADSDRGGGLTMGVLYLWITTSLVSGTMPVQETRQIIQRQQEHK